MVFYLRIESSNRDFRRTYNADHRSQEYLFLGNIDPELQLSVLEQMKQPRLVACDTMNYWIDSKKEALLRTLSKTDLLIITILKPGSLRMSQT
jgi:hypothetical protein